MKKEGPSFQPSRLHFVDGTHLVAGPVVGFSTSVSFHSQESRNRIRPHSQSCARPPRQTPTDRERSCAKDGHTPTYDMYASRFMSCPFAGNTDKEGLSRLVDTQRIPHSGIKPIKELQREREILKQRKSAKL